MKNKETFYTDSNIQSKYTIHSIVFKLGDSINDNVKDLPHGYGVYRIYANNPHGELLYIGKAGTICNDGHFKLQDVRKRLTMKQEGLSRQQFFTNKLKEHSEYEQLYIECLILKDDSVLPAYLEALLIQKYYSENGVLPSWNKSF